jgi:hypothetical protein
MMFLLLLVFLFHFSHRAALIDAKVVIIPKHGNLMEEKSLHKKLFPPSSMVLLPMEWKEI